MTTTEAESSGSRSASTGRISFEWPLVGPDQQAALLRCLAAGDLSMPHGVTSQLEAAVAHQLAVPHVVAHANGTSAMLSALYAAGVGMGDEVICPAYTWWASISPVLWLGGIPVFCDVEPVDLTIDVTDMAGRITSKTRAIIVPHLWGAAANLDPIMEVARQHEVVVIEDASHAFGATASGRPLGTIADLGVFSMQAQKPLPAGEGGLLVTKSAALHQRSLAVGHYERLTADPVHDPYRGTGLGLKLRISPLNAALALSYLPTLGDVLSHQDQLLRAMLAPILMQPFVHAVGLQPHVRHGGRAGLRLVFAESYLGVRGVTALAKAIAAAGLPSKPEYFLPLHQAPLFAVHAPGPRHGALRTTEALAPRLLHASLPVSGSEVAARELGNAVATVLEAWNGAA